MTQTAIDYGRVLYELEVDRNDIEDTKDKFKNTPILLSVLENPRVKLSEKFNAIDKIFSTPMNNFLKVVLKNGCIEYIEEILNAYEEQYDIEKGILNAKLMYVNLPNERQKNDIISFLKNKFEVLEVNIELIHSPKLISGFVIEARNIEFDMSVLGKINQLKQKLIRR